MIAAVLLFIGAAGATIYNVDVCAKLGTDFTDAASSNNDDYLKSNTDVAARGVHVKVVRMLLGTEVETIADMWANQSGTNAGCIPTTLLLDSTKSYKTKIISEFAVNGETVGVYQAFGGWALTVYASGLYSPTQNETWTTTTTGNYEDWNIVAAGAYAIWRNDLGNGTDAFNAFSDPCPTGGGSCYCPTSDSNCTVYTGVYINPTAGAYDSKYQIAHEFGHALMHYRYDSSGNNNTAVPDSVCWGKYNTSSGSSHYFISHEYMGSAFWEGFANYYATAAFNNNTTQTDCAFGLYKAVDWNRLHDDNEPIQFIDCAGDPVIEDPGDTPSSFSVDGTDYMGAYCALISGCTSNWNRGTEFDWVAFLWHLDAAESMAPDNFADIYVEARTNGGGYQTTGCGNGATWPAYELREAAYRKSTLWGANWNTSDGTYGVDQ